MSIYSFIDEAALKTASRMIRNVRYFAESVNSRRLVEMPAYTGVTLSAFDREGYIEARGAADGVDIDPGVLVSSWAGWEAPLVIYHHGAAEGKFDFGFRKIFKDRLSAAGGLNVIAIKAPFSATNSEFYKAIRNMKTYTALISGSTVLVEEIVRTFRKRSDAPVVISGTSLGGVVSCLHSLTFKSGGCSWLPLYAGPQIGEVFVESAYAGICDEGARTEQADEIRRVLNFGDEFKTGVPERVYPLLGKSDMVFNYGLQSQYYKRDNITATKKGHSTGAAAFAELRAYLSDRIHRVTDGRQEYAGR